MFGIKRMKLTTRNFYKYFKNLSFEPEESWKRINIAATTGLPDDSLILSGSEIFKIFF